VKTEQEIFEELATLCASPGYAHAIAFFCLRDNIIGYKDELKGDDFNKLFSTDRLIRTEISTLIGLMVRKQVDYSVPSQQQLHTFIAKSEALLEELHEALGRPLKQGVQAALAGQQGDPFDTAVAMREPIFYGSESAYIFQYRDFAAKKYARDDDWLRKKRGFSIEDARQVVIAVCNFMNENLLSTLRDYDKDDWNLLDGFKFSSVDIVSKSSLPKELVTAVLTSFSFKNDANPTFISLQAFNSINAYPLVKMDNDDRYILFQQYSLAEALYDTQFYWMTEDEDYKEVAMANRGKFTEEFATERLGRVFGSDKVSCNVSIWESKGRKLGEIDALVLFADRAIVVQAKSKKLTLAARKGNDLQLQSDFKSAVQDACDQGYSCSEQIVLATSRFTDAEGKVVQIPKFIKQIYQICLVSDHYPALSFQAQQFLKKMTTERIKVPLVCDVFLLDVVTEMLDGPLRCLSYLDLRSSAGNNVVMSHETTALGFHLKRNLWLGQYDAIYLDDGISADVEAAMTVRREGMKGQSTPPGVWTQMQHLSVGRLIREFERKPDAATTGLGLELLKLGGSSVRDISQAVDKIVSDAGRDGMEHDVTVALGETKSGVTIHCSNLPNLDAGVKLRRHCEIRKYSQRAATWFGIAIQPRSGALRFGLTLDYPWEADSQLDKAVQKMPQAGTRESLRRFIEERPTARRKVSRNERCPCGSGLKYKKCCLAVT
jgi:hypothetical protein